MHIALDIDGTITEAPAFFSLLTRALRDARITVVSFRQDEAEASRLLAELGIRYDALVLINDPALGNRDDESWEVWKAGLVARLGVDVFFEDMPEVVRLVRAPTKVFMACDEGMREWLALCVDRV
jgi:pimeloyl-ACP methyl ester carboxylesterase